MLFKTKFLTLIQAGKIETAFRKWTRPTVKESGILITAVGQLRINAVSKISYQNITDEETIAGRRHRATFPIFRSVRHAPATNMSSLRDSTLLITRVCDVGETAIIPGSLLVLFKAVKKNE